MRKNLYQNSMAKFISRLVISALLGIFIAALLWATASSAEVTGQTTPTFMFAPQASTGLAPQAVELADMDGDGDLDLVTSNLVDQEFSTVSVSKNNGNGTFAPPVDYAVGPNPTDLRLADFNGDGRPDVVCHAALSGENPGEQSFATVLFNNGTGGLINRIDYPVGENANPGALDVGDYTGDGITDFAIASLMTGVYVYRNTGNGNFVLWTNFAGFSESTHIASTDFDGDGRLDLVAGNTDDARIYMNNGSGFTAGFTLANFGDGVSGIATGDFDNDGKPDVALTGRNLSVYRNLGGGTSFAKTAYLSGENGTGIKTADMDGDGKLDITVSNSLGNSVSVYSNNGSGQFPDKREWGVGLAPNSHGIGDVNGDGKLDIVAPASNLSYTTVNVVLNAGNRTYVARRDYGMLGSAWGVDFADFNRDGYRDVVSGGVVSNQDGPFVFYGKPDGTLQDGIQVDFWSNNAPTDVAVGDFNGDGWPDFVSSIFSPGNRIRVNINQGNGTFLPSVSYTAGGNPRGVGIGDLNGDGKLDIVNAQAALNDNSISIFIGNGNGTFQPQVKVDAGFRPIDVLLADFDQNGRSEIIVTHSGSNAIYYFKPNAAGVLGAPQIIDIGSTQGNAVAADFDNDGWLDIMVGAGNAVLLRNNQTGGFLPPVTTPVPAGFIAAGDWDQDGLMDVVGTNGVLNLALVGWNHGGGNFTYVSSLQAGFETARVGAADLNGDGLPEIVTCNLRARSISVFKNIIPSNRADFDYDGDGKTDISVFRPSTGAWYLNRSQAGFLGTQFGIATDKIAPADFDGDGKTDIAVYRPSDGNWYILNSSNGVVTVQHFGLAADVPIPGDFDGDGKADVNVFRNSDGTWYRLNSSNGAFVATQFGSNGDKPQAGDFDGDGKADIAVFRPSIGAWYWIRSSNGTVAALNFGLSTDLPVPADYDGDGKTDVAVYRPSEGNWFMLRSSDGVFIGQTFGIAADIPTPGDYDGDGRADVAIFRPSDGTCWMNRTTAGVAAVAFGQNGDKPTPSAFVY